MLPKLLDIECPACIALGQYERMRYKAVFTFLDESKLSSKYGTAYGFGVKQNGKREAWKVSMDDLKDLQFQLNKFLNEISEKSDSPPEFG